MQTELLALADRVEALEGPDRGVFEEAWIAVGRPKWSGEDWRHPDTPEFRAWSKFETMLYAEAWTSAAEMFLPEGWRLASLSEGVDGVWTCTLTNAAASFGAMGAQCYGASNEANARLIASLRARAGRV